jgi:aconitate hydratase
MSGMADAVARGLYQSRNAGMGYEGPGGLDVALAMAGQPFTSKSRKSGASSNRCIPGRVHAKDLILDLLRRHNSVAASACVIEYYGPGICRPPGDGSSRHRHHGREAGRDRHRFPSDGEVMAIRSTLLARTARLDASALRGDLQLMSVEVNLTIRYSLLTGRQYAAHGIASRRFRGIVSPQSSQIPNSS